MKEELNGRTPQWKRTSKEDTSNGDNLKGRRRHQWGTSSMKDDINIDSINVDNLN